MLASYTPTALITGARSGLGLELARQFAERGWNVIASHHAAEPPDPVVEAMSHYPSIRYQRIDVSDPAAIRDAAMELTDQPIDLLINNAAIAFDDSPTGNGHQTFGHYDAGQFHRIFNVNVLGALLVTQEFLDHIRSGQHKKIVSISSTNGSLTAPLAGSLIFYKSSKSALNRAMLVVAETLKPEGIIVSLIHPGAVATEKNVLRGRTDYPGMIDTQFSVTRMMGVIERLTIADTGKFYNYDGGFAPW